MPETSRGKRLITLSTLAVLSGLFMWYWLWITTEDHYAPMIPPPGIDKNRASVASITPPPPATGEVADIVNALEKDTVSEEAINLEETMDSTLISSDSQEIGDVGQFNENDF